MFFPLGRSDTNEVMGLLLARNGSVKSAAYRYASESVACVAAVRKQAPRVTCSQAVRVLKEGGILLFARFLRNLLLFP